MVTEADGTRALHVIYEILSQNVKFMHICIFMHEKKKTQDQEGKKNWALMKEHARLQSAAMTFEPRRGRRHRRDYQLLCKCVNFMKLSVCVLCWSVLETQRKLLLQPHKNAPNKRAFLTAQQS